MSHKLSCLSQPVPEEECIPVGCVPSATVAVSGGGVCQGVGVCLEKGACLPRRGRVYLGGGCLPRRGVSA